jgi:ribosomal protein S18 acetylase RimI-like enzyme
MGTLCVSLDKASVANQLVNLINKNNQLKRIQTVSSILSGKTKYLVEFGGYNVRNSKQERLVVGCIGLELLQPDVLLLKHLSTHGKFRRLGIANSLLSSALKECTTNHVRMRIRTDNYPSLNLAEKFGFVYLFHENLGEYNIITVGRNINNGIERNR